jgi:hypothetical protein
MHNALRAIRTLIIPVLLGISLSACAFGRAEIAVPAPVHAATPTGPAVKIVDVRDLRQFSLNPRDPSESSIGEPGELNDMSVTTRLVGRKRNGWGRALGDVALPPPSTVPQLVSSTAEAALHSRGYLVVREGSPAYASALPFSLDIEQFWAWFDPWSLSASASMKAKVAMSGEPIGPAPATAETLYQASEFAMTESVWSKTVQAGLADLFIRMSEKIRPASELRR